ncbi:MAG: NADH-quinone oxidoreductase subunit 6 [Actinobacteria bacterium ADurb.Bin346]|nr:MAG: NADH-quinone oxidoreductase subunit 6 [Actinobacteria bacterium ADurb.Bin346]
MRSLVKNNLNIIVAGFGCCKQEILATTGPTYDISRFGVNFVSVPEEADVLVIQGFYNEIGEERLLEIYSRMKKPKWVIATGKCIVDRCLLNEDYNFTERLGKIINVDFYVPGCPPRPEAFIYAVLRLLEAGQ